MFKIGDTIVNKLTGYTFTIINIGSDNRYTLVNSQDVTYHSYLDKDTWEHIDNTPIPKETFMVVDSNCEYIGTFDSIELAENEIQAIVSDTDVCYHDTTYTIAKIIKTVSVERVVTYNLFEVKE